MTDIDDVHALFREFILDLSDRLSAQELEDLLHMEKFGSNADGDEIFAFSCQDCHSILGVSTF